MDLAMENTTRTQQLKTLQLCSRALTFLLFASFATSAYSDVANPSADLKGLSDLITPEYVIVKAKDEATFSSETAARVAKLPIKEGSSFRVGDVLLELDCRVQQAELKKAMAQQSAANIAEISAEKLKKFDAISQYELIKAASEEQIANAEVDKLKTIVEKCIIKAPFNGAIAELMIHAYESVKPGDPLLKIINTENPDLEMQLPSSWLQWLRVGSKFSVHINEINSSIEATVTKINPQIEAVSQTVKVVGAVTKPDDRLLPGMSGQATFLDNPTNQQKKSQ